MNFTSNPEHKGSRPPPTHRPQTGALSIFFIMAMVIGAAFVSSGGSAPVDPNGPGGPPTLEPYFTASDYGQQKIVMPTDKQFAGQEKNLQLKTFTVEGCGQRTALYFVIDTSGSMKFEGKLEKEKSALQQFLKRLGDKSVVGITTFSKDVKEEVPINYVKTNKKALEKTISGLKADGHTRTRSAMKLAKEKIAEAIVRQDFPGYRYTLILMTDGVPEVPASQEPKRTCHATASDPNTAPDLRCFAKDEDPLIPSNIAAEIKQLNVEIYSINIYSPNYPSDKTFYPLLKKLLNDVASDPKSSHYYESISGNNLDAILNKICSPTNEIR